VIDSLNTQENAPILERSDYFRIAVFSAFQVASLVLFLIFARSVFTAYLAVRESFYFYPTPTILQAIAAFIQKFNRGLFLCSDAVADIPLPLISAIPPVLCFAFSFLVLKNTRTTKAVYQKRWQYLADNMTPEQQAFFLTMHGLRSSSSSTQR
jgi:hypothetical protein